jgi:hypothetical protein
LKERKEKEILQNFLNLKKWFSKIILVFNFKHWP